MQISSWFPGCVTTLAWCVPQWPKADLDVKQLSLTYQQDFPPAFIVAIVPLTYVRLRMHKVPVQGRRARNSCAARDFPVDQQYERYILFFGEKSETKSWLSPSTSNVPSEARHAAGVAVIAFTALCKTKLSGKVVLRQRVVLTLTVSIALADRCLVPVPHAWWSRAVEHHQQST